MGQVKQEYSQSLTELEKISEEIHRRREMRRGPREPGVGAEKSSPVEETAKESLLEHLSRGMVQKYENDDNAFSLPDVNAELDCCDKHSLSSLSVGTSSERDDDEISEISHKLIQVRFLFLCLTYNSCNFFQESPLQIIFLI